MVLARRRAGAPRTTRAGPEGSGIGNTRNQRSGQHRADPRNVMKALARLVGPMPGQDHPIELQNLLLESEQLSTERGKAGTGNLRHPFVARVGNNMQQFRDPSTPDRRYNAELGKVRSDRVNHRGLLTDEQMEGGEASGNSAARVSLLARTA